MTQSGSIQPLHYIPFDGPQAARDVFFLDETGRAIFLLHVEVIDIWEVAVSVWPEVLGSLAGLWLLVGLWIVWRRAQRPQRPGVLFCRRCNYELGKVEDREHLLAEGDKCTECGFEITPRLLVPGRAQRWRILRPLALGLLPGVAFGVLVALVGLNRTGAAVRWFDLPSVRLSEWTAQHEWTWFDSFRRGTDRFEEWDLEAGQRVRVVRTGAGRTYTRASLTVDGSGLIATGGRFSSLVCIETSSGRIRSRLMLPGKVWLAFNKHAIVPHPTDAERVFALVLDKNAEEHVLYAWNTKSGVSSELLRMPAWSYQPRRPVERRLSLTTIESTPMLVMLPTFMESYNRDVFEVIVLSLAGEVVRTFEIDPKPDPMSAVVAPGEPRLYASRNMGLVGVDLANGKAIGTLRGDTMIMATNLATTASGRLLLVPSVDDAILVRDTRAATWLGPLVEDTPAYGLQLSVSPAGRWVTAVAQRNTAAPLAKGATHDVLVWKLPAEWFTEPSLTGTDLP